LSAPAGAPGELDGVARRIHAMRRQRKLSLDGLAERTGLTKSFLSKIERGVSIPSIATVLKLARAFDVDVAHLFGQAVESQSICIERARTSNNGRGRLNVVPIAGKRAQKNMSPFIMYPTPEGEEHFNEHAGEEFLYVLRGEIEMEFADRKERLKAGDSIYFEGHLLHRQRSISADAATLIVIEGRDS
jgi:transcriptional regulator with XRE-family HTH domain